MIFIIDNDIILKLGKWDLLSELIHMLGVDMKDIHRLSTCQYALCYPSRPQKALKRCGDQETIDRITEFCAQTTPIPEPAESIWLERLNAVPDIDIGEVLIFAVGIEKTDSITYIGDKRSLVALATSSGLTAALAELRGRAKCLEQIIAEMIVLFGLVEMVDKIRARTDADKAMNMIFGTHPLSRRPGEVWEGLISYYGALSKATDGLLAEFPEAPATLCAPQMAL